MKKFSLLASIVAVVLLVSALSGCDNRSQMEKDADSAAKKVSNMLK